MMRLRLSRLLFPASASLFSPASFPESHLLHRSFPFSSSCRCGKNRSSDSVLHLLQSELRMVGNAGNGKKERTEEGKGGARPAAS